MNGRKLFSLLKPIIKTLSLLLSFMPLVIRKFLYECTVFIPTKVGVFLRYCVVSSITKDIGDNVYIGRYVVLKNIENLSIGNNVSIHEFCYIDAIGHIKIGSDVSIAHRSSLVSFEHGYSDRSKPIKYNEIIKKEIIVDDDVWLGAGCIVLGGAVVSERVVLAAGTVYKLQGESNNIYGGVPAKIIKGNI